MKKEQTIIFLKHFFISLCIISFSILVLLCSVDDNVFSPYINQKFCLLSKTVFMESFDFFTKSPQEEQIRLIEIDSVSLHRNKINLRNNSKYNLYGFSRNNRLRLIELGRIDGLFSNMHWKQIREDSLSEALINNNHFQIVGHEENKFRVLRKGKYIMIKSKPIPWEFNQIKKHIVIKYLPIEIE